MSARTASANLLNAYHLLSFDSLDSTNEEAKRLAKAGGSHGAVICTSGSTAAGCIDAPEHSPAPFCSTFPPCATTFRSIPIPASRPSW